VPGRPTTQLIQRYVDEAQKLLARGELTNEEIHELRYGPESRAILMQQTRGNPGDVSDKTVQAILDEYRQRRVHEAREAADADVQAARKDAAEERKLRETIEDRVRELEAAEETRKEREFERHRRRKRLCERRARRRARMVGRIAFLGIGIPAMAILLISLISALFGDLRSVGLLRVFGPLWWVALPFAVAAALLGAANQLWGRRPRALRSGCSGRSSGGCVAATSSRRCATAISTRSYSRRKRTATPQRRAAATWK
jgi:hypothetical protein